MPNQSEMMPMEKLTRSGDPMMRELIQSAVDSLPTKWAMPLRIHQERGKFPLYWGAVVV